MSKKHQVIIIPGLGDKTTKLSLATRHWRRYDLEPVIHSIGWHDEKKFQSKLQIFVSMIDEFVKNGDRVSLVGCSAGGSAVLNAFLKRKTKVHKVINVCGRLQKGVEQGYRSFTSRTASSPAFAESVKLVEQQEQFLSTRDRKRIMTVRPLWYDEVVPEKTAMLSGAYNTIVPIPGHVFGITMALTLFSRPLITFLKSEEGI
jgi:hypothetical protein